jgi:hypothetical protein
MVVIVDVVMVTKFQVVGWLLGGVLMGPGGKVPPFFIVITTTGLVVHLYGPVFWQISPVLPLAVTVVFCVVA